MLFSSFLSTKQILLTISLQNTIINIKLKKIKHLSAIDFFNHIPPIEGPNGQREATYVTDQLSKF